MCFVDCSLGCYAFANGNPVSYVDPYGHAAQTARLQAHLVLDAAGMIPAVGAVFDIANGMWYAAEGDWGSAGISTAAALPMVGIAATTAKYGAKAVSGLNKGIKTQKAEETITDPAVAAALVSKADRKGTALTKNDLYHYAATFVPEKELATGQVSLIVGGDGVRRTLLQVNGKLEGKVGVYEYIIDNDGKVSHQRFKPGKFDGKVN